MKFYTVEILFGLVSVKVFKCDSMTLIVIFRKHWKVTFTLGGWDLVLHLGALEGRKKEEETEEERRGEERKDDGNFFKNRSYQIKI